MMRLATTASLALLFLFCAVSADDCPCTLDQTGNDPVTYSWDCSSRGLTEIPIDCFSEQSEGVTELNLSYNSIGAVRTIDLFTLDELKYLYLDYNELTFFDPSALQGVNEIEYINLSYNSRQGTTLDFDTDLLLDQPNLKSFISIGSGLNVMPTLTGSPLLEGVDARSNALTTLPRPLFTNLTANEILVNFAGSSIMDVAVDILLPLPVRSTIYFEDGVTFWAATQGQMDEFTNKNFEINKNFDYNLRICIVNGTPADSSMC